MTRDGSDIGTLIRRSKACTSGSLLVVKDAQGVLFGALMTEPLKNEGDKYYGNGTLQVWSFSSGVFQVLSHISSIFLLREAI